MTSTPDLVIRGGSIADGKGGAMFEADVAISGGRITEVGKVSGTGKEEIDAKELIYMAVSVTNACRYCIASHGAAARKKGMTPEQHAELVAIIGLANETNRHAVALDLQIDDRFR